MPDDNFGPDRLRGELQKTFQRAVKMRVLSPALRDALKQRENRIVNHFGEERLKEVKAYRCEYPKRLAAEVRNIMVEQHRLRPELRPRFAGGNGLTGSQIQDRAKHKVKAEHQTTLDQVTRQETKALNLLYDEFLKSQPDKGRLKAEFGRVVEFKSSNTKSQIHKPKGPSRTRS